MSRGLLLDTNIPSELMRKLLEPRIRQWLTSQRDESLFMSVITIGELRKGMSLLAFGRRRYVLEDWLENDLLPRFAGRVLPLTERITNRWGILSAECQQAGTPLGPVDGLIAATAWEHSLTLVSHNVKHMAITRVDILNPWELPA